jgi:hypothetical protein
MNVGRVLNWKKDCYEKLLKVKENDCRLYIYIVYTLQTASFYDVHFSTWNNAQLGDTMIQQLENQGLQMAKERQDYFGEGFVWFAFILFT